MRELHFPSLALVAGIRLAAGSGRGSPFHSLGVTMTRDDEPYVHFQESLSNINSAWQILGELGDVGASRILRRAAYHMALIEYAKPFKSSFGANKRRHTIAFPLTSAADVKLHRSVIDLRDQFLAHSDISIKDATVYLGQLAGKPFPLIISNVDLALPEPSAIKALVERVLDALYSQIPIYESKFKT